MVSVPVFYTHQSFYGCQIGSWIAVVLPAESSLEAPEQEDSCFRSFSVIS